MGKDAQQLLKKAQDMLDKYHAVMSRDDLPNLKDFEGIVRDLCGEITKLPKKEADLYQKTLVELSKSLEKLANGLEEKKEKVQNQIENLGHNKKAQTAYLVAGGLAPKQGEEKEE